MLILRLIGALGRRSKGDLEAEHGLVTRLADEVAAFDGDVAILGDFDNDGFLFHSEPPVI